MIYVILAVLLYYALLPKADLLFACVINLCFSYLYLSFWSPNFTKAYLIYDNMLVLANEANRPEYHYSQIKEIRFHFCYSKLFSSYTLVLKDALQVRILMSHINSDLLLQKIAKFRSDVIGPDKIESFKKAQAVQELLWMTVKERLRNKVYFIFSIAIIAWISYEFSAGLNLFFLRYFLYVSLGAWVLQIVLDYFESLAHSKLSYAWLDDRLQIKYKTRGLIQIVFLGVYYGLLVVSPILTKTLPTTFR